MGRTTASEVEPRIVAQNCMPCNTHGDALRARLARRLLRPVILAFGQGERRIVADFQRIYPGDVQRGEIEIVQEQVVWTNSMVRLFNDRVRFPGTKDGHRVEGEQFRVAHAPDKDDGVVIAPITATGELLLVHLFRHPVRLWMREFPRGARSRGESAEDAARRELSEELGCEASRLIALGRIAPDSGQLAGLPHLFAALVGRRGQRHQESTETIDRTCSYRFTALKEACVSGEIIDAFTLGAVLRLEPYFNGDRFTPPASA